MADSPYDASRAARPPPSKGLPSLAVYCAVPSQASYAAEATPIVAIVLPFQRLYDDKGQMRDDIQDDKGDVAKCYSAWKELKIHPKIYVKFGGFKLLDYIYPDPKKKEVYYLRCDAFISDVYERFKNFTSPTASEFCIDDPNFVIAQNTTNMFGGNGPFPVLKYRSETIESVPTFWEQMWRKDINRRWIEALLPNVLSVSACYYTNQSEFTYLHLEPSPDKAGPDDNGDYYDEITAELYRRVRRMNAILSIISNYGITAGLHETYVKRLDRLRVEIGGHTDDMGTDKGNDALSADRAQKVMNHLLANMSTALTYPSSVTKVVDAVSERLTSKGYAAKECPTKKPNEDRSCRKITVRLVSVS